MAESSFKRALAIGEKIFPNNIASSLYSAGGLGSIYESRGKYAEAESFYIKMVDLYNKVLTRTRPDIAVASNDLARIYIAEKKYAEAEALLRKALEINEHNLGPQ